MESIRAEAAASLERSKERRANPRRGKWWYFIPLAVLIWGAAIAYIVGTLL